MARRYAQWVLAIAAVVGVAISVWLMVEYALPVANSSCGPGGGCATVRQCKSMLVLKGYWPPIGAVAFGGLLTMALSSSERVRRWLPLVGTGAALTGLGLLVSQRVVCGAFCRFCIVADVAGLAFGVAAWVDRLAKPEAEGPPPVWLGSVHRAVFGGLAGASVIAAFAWGLSRPQVDTPVEARQVQELPAPIAREQRPGVATVVEFADFECPYCRRQHTQMAPVIASYGARVRFVRKHTPLSFHQHAMGAALAACCAEEQGRGDAMADALFTSDDLTPEGCEAVANRLGLDRAAFRACVAAPATRARIDRDHAEATESRVEGIPTTFVGSERFDGVVSSSALRASIDRALRSTPPAPHTPSS